MNTYGADRPNIPANIRREIEVEAGHKCAVTTCNEHTYLEIHHINQNREDNYKENLVLLCDKHHKMAHAGVIDRKALRSYKELLNARTNGNNFIRGQEGDRVHRFVRVVCDILSYNNGDEISSAGSETGYWFEEEIHIKLCDFFLNIHDYNQVLRSYDPSASARQDRVVSLLQQILNIREQSDYRFNGGYSARFTPRHPLGTSEYDNEITVQIKLVQEKLLEIQKLVFELWGYVESRPL